jgi:glycosyltransferase involved in cell wall biosynthesis
MHDAVTLAPEGVLPACSRENIRVLHIIHSLLAGGTERQLLELLRGLQKEECITCEVAVLSTDVHFKEAAQLAFPIHYLPRRRRYDLSIFPRLNRVVRDFRPHIVHSWNSMCSVYGAPLAMLAGARFVNGYVRAAAATLGMGDRDYARGKLTIPFSDVVVSNSRAGLAAYGVPTAKGVCIHNGFDQQRLDGLAPAADVRMALGITTPHIVGMVASFSDLKDYDSFFRSAQDVLAVRDDVTFVAVGDGVHFKRFQSLFPQGRHPGIRLLGRRQDVESVVSTFTIGVLTSNTRLHGEGIANALMECMALGKPVIATDCGGNGELVVEGQTGFLIAGADTDALTKHIALLLDDASMASRLGENGRRRIREEFSLERMTQAHVTLYGPLAGMRRP